MTTQTKGVSPESGADLTADITSEEASEIYDEAGREMNVVQSSSRTEAERSINDIAEEYGVDTIPEKEEDYGVDPEEAEETSISAIYDEAGENTTEVQSNGYDVFGVKEKLKEYCSEVGIDTVDEDAGYANRSFRRDRTGSTSSQSLDKALGEDSGIIGRLLGF